MQLVYEDAGLTLEEKYEELLMKYEALKSEYDKLVSENSFAAFRLKVSEKLGIALGAEKGWQKSFIDGFDNKYNTGDIAKWRRTNYVPKEVFEDIKNIDLERISEKHCNGKRWSDDEIEIMRSYTIKNTDGYIRIKDGYTIETLAQELSEKFKRPISDGSVKSKLNSFRNVRR